MKQIRFILIAILVYSSIFCMENSLIRNKDFIKRNNVTIDLAIDCLMKSDFDYAWELYKKCFPPNFEIEYQYLSLNVPEVPTNFIDLKYKFEAEFHKYISLYKKDVLGYYLRTVLFDVFSAFIISDCFSHETRTHLLELSVLIANSVLTKKSSPLNVKLAMKIGLARIYKSYALYCDKIQAKKVLEISKKYFLEILEDKKLCFSSRIAYIHNTLARELADIFKSLNQDNESLFWFNKATNYPKEILLENLPFFYLEQANGLYEYGSFLYEFSKNQPNQQKTNSFLNSACLKLEKFLKIRAMHNNASIVFEQDHLKEEQVKDLDFKEQKAIEILFSIYIQLYKKNKDKKAVEKHILQLVSDISIKSIEQFCYHCHKNNYHLFLELLKEIVKRKENNNKEIQIQAFLYYIHYLLEQREEELALKYLAQLHLISGTTIKEENDVTYLYAIANRNLGHKNYFAGNIHYKKYNTLALHYIGQILSKLPNAQLQILKKNNIIIKKSFDFLKKGRKSPIFDFAYSCNLILNKYQNLLIINKY